MSLPYYKPLLLRWGWVVVACALLGATGAWIASTNSTELFRARYYISLVPADMDWRIRDLAKELAFNSTARFPQADLVEQVRATMDLPPAEIATSLGASFDRGTLIITIEAHHTNADVAGALATVAADTFFAEQSAYFVEQDFTGSVDFERISASPEIQQLAPNDWTNTLAGLVLGLVAGIALLLFFMWQEEERLARPEIISRNLELPVLGQLTLD